MTTSTVVTGRNITADTTTVPACFDVAPPYVALWTAYLPPTTTIHVLDQFGYPLEAMFNGADVKERYPFGGPAGSWDPINVTVSNGSYSDQIFIYLHGTPHIALVSSAAAAKWVNPAIKPPLNLAKETGVFGGGGTENIDVEVGGVQLNPGIVARGEAWSEPGGNNTPVTFTLTW